MKHQRVFQTGTQQRSDAKFRQAVALARSGSLGKVHTIEVAVPAGGGIRKQPTAPVPPGFDYDMWTGPAPMHPFDNRRCEWLGLYWIADYCVGFICNWGIHHLDIAAWGCPEVATRPSSSRARPSSPPRAWPTPRSSGAPSTAIPAASAMSFTSDRGPFDWQKQQDPTEESLRVLGSVDLKQHHETGCRFIGSEGWVHVTRGAISAEPASLLTKELDPEKLGIVVSHDHYVNFLECVRDGRAGPNLESGHRATILGNAADICVRLGRPLKWDPKAERFTGDDEANRKLSQPMRAPWHM